MACAIWRGALWNARAPAMAALDSNIAVFDIGGNLNNKFRQRGFRKGTVRHSSIQRAGQQLTRRIQRSLAGVIVFVIHVVPPVWKLGGRS